MSNLILASASPRRKSLLSTWLSAFDTIPADVDESRLGAESPREYVARVAELKADALVQSYPEHFILAADTTVALGHQIFGKPVDEQDAQQILATLSGTSHQVFTAIVLKGPAFSQVQVIETVVTFSPLSQSQITAYCNTDEPYDKAGAYGIQGAAMKFVESISGSYTAVVGLPLTQTAMLLRQAGFVLKGDK